MKLELRRVHHLTAEESQMLLLFRLLPQAAKESIERIAALQVCDKKMPDNVVSIGSRNVA